MLEDWVMLIACDELGGRTGTHRDDLVEFELDGVQQRRGEDDSSRRRLELYCLDNRQHQHLLD